MKTIKNFFSLLLLGGMSLGLAANDPSATGCKPAGHKDGYTCLPCGRNCDRRQLSGPGTCSECGMRLVKTTTVVFKTIRPSKICEYVSRHPGVVLLDVRTREEFEGRADPDFGTLKNAINVPLQELEARMTGMDSLKHRDIIVYCSHSHRSPQASYILSTNGFTHVSNMAGGMSQMKDAACVKQ